MDNTNLQKPHSMVTFSDPNEKDYLVLIIGETEEEKEFRDFEWITGRKEVYQFIKDLILGSNIHITKSKVIAEGQPIENAKTLLDFMRTVVESGLIEDPGFDIMDYMVGDETEEEE